MVKAKAKKASSKNKHAKSTKSSKKHMIKSKKMAIIYASIFASLLVLVAAAGLVAAHYRNRAMPGTQVASVNVGGKTEGEIQQIVRDQYDAIKLKIVNGDQNVTASAGDLGISVDINKTAADAVSASSSGNVFSNFNPLATKNVDMAVTYDVGKLQDYLNTSFPDSTVQANDASIAYNEETSTFDVVPGTQGKSVNAKNLESTLADLVQRPRQETEKVVVAESEPLISDAAATEAQQAMNERIGLRFNLNYDGKLLYFVDPPDIAKWADFTANPNTGKIDIEFDKAKIKQFLTDKVAPSLASAPVDKKVLVDKSGKELVVLQEGKNGLQPKDMGSLVDSVHGAVQKGNGLDQNLDLAEAAYKTTTLVADDTKWVEVDLGRQTTTLYNGSTPVQTFVISSGVAKFPTVTGEFRVWYKTPTQTMSGGSKAAGDYYSLADVKWDTYFFEDYAFHTAYWHNNFGTPMSHGCINMREADAKVVYDFAPIGTKVIVHY